MKTKLDNLHFSDNHAFSFNDIPIKFLISPREPGKSTALTMRMWRLFNSGKTTLVIRRYIADITKKYIDSFAEIVEKFTGAKIKLTYSESDRKSGICDVFVNGKLWFTIVALNAKMNRIKSCVTKKLGLVFFDEFIANTFAKEKYIDGEAIAFKEIYSTFNRESDCKPVPCVFCGNPYSVYNPYFFMYGVDLKRIAYLMKERDHTATWVHPQRKCIVQVIKLKPQLREKILKDNPFYAFDDSYTKYALSGFALNDADIILVPKQPKGFRLDYLFKYDEKELGVFVGRDNDKNINYWLGWVNLGHNKKVYCFDFKNFLNKTKLVNDDDKDRFIPLKRSIAYRAVAYQDVSIYYFIQEVYKKL